jgi:hypothetical protein
MSYEQWWLLQMGAFLLWSVWVLHDINRGAWGMAVVHAFLGTCAFASVAYAGT